tara:strand:+ start:3016 stop:4095 length:1080 start_codon:yes stop_codon:yes gene_type:complete
MQKKISLCFLLTAFVLFSCKEKKNEAAVENQASTEMEQSPKITFTNDEANKKVVVKIDGQPFTSYVYDGQTPKPILYPILTKSGKIVTRGFPFAPRPNERVDHPHHAGYWLNYGDVNGLDFWNNSYAIPAAEKHKYGTIYHQEIVAEDEAKGTLSVKAMWRSPDGTDLLEENTEFTFSEVGDTRYIDRVTTLNALEDVSFKDNKEGMIGIRVARELELPSDKPAIYTDSEGNETTVESANNDGVSGDYLGSEGATGESVWGTRNKWVKLEGNIADEVVSITLIDHPKNVGYPTYWHARGYGLFAANPLGQAIFSEGKEILDFKLQKSESVTFRYRMMIHNGSELSKAIIDGAFEDFNKN